MDNNKNNKKDYKKNLLLGISLALLLFSLVGLGFRWRDQYNNEQAVEEARKIARESRESESEDFYQQDAITIGWEREATDEAPKEALPFIQELQEKNPEVVGWIEVAGTEIDYPVVQAEDNEFYLKRDWLGQDNSAGAIFMDYRNDPLGLEERKTHTILYGHHRQDGSMFQNLMNYKDEAYFRENPTFEVTDQYGTHTFEIFSVYVTSIDFYFIETRFPEDEDFEVFLDSIIERRKFDSDVKVSAEDHLLTLSTCTYEYDDARFVVHARRVEE
ncbi:class B sortase [Isachenkonia alkalipeptolytica]|uniref:class B sortase n=1 Tax=Isachenkonia alkalipeptolytica TaxID=2565777 RepID=UPI00136CE4C7